MKRSHFIWTLLLVVAAASPGVAQGGAGASQGESFYLEQAIRDGQYEHQLRFARASDEMDFWNDQRAFEQELFSSSPEHYRMYLMGKRRSYMEHQGACQAACGHGDYYLRQASFYLQHNSGADSDLLTLTPLKGERGWEVTYAPINQQR